MLRERVPILVEAKQRDLILQSLSEPPTLLRESQTHAFSLRSTGSVIFGVNHQRFMFFLEESLLLETREMILSDAPDKVISCKVFAFLHLIYRNYIAFEHTLMPEILKSLLLKDAEQ